METPGNDIEQQGGVKLGEGGFGAVYTPRIPCARGQGYDIIRDKGLVRRDDERLTVKDGMKSVSKVFKSVRDMRNESASLKVASKHLAKNFTDAERNKWFVMAEKQCTIPREFFESADEAAEVHGEQYGREWFADKSGRNAKLLPRISEPKQLIFPRGDFDIETIFETLEPKNQDVFWQQFTNIVDAVAGLQRGRLLHGDIKMLNAVLHEDRFKLIDLAGVTSYDQDSVIKGDFVYGLSYGSMAGQYVNPITNAQMPLFGPPGAMREMPARTRELQMEIARRPTELASLIGGRFLQAANGFQTEEYNMSTYIRKICNIHNHEPLLKILCDDIMMNVEKSGRTFNYVASRVNIFLIHASSPQERIDYIFGRCDAYAVARMMARALVKTHRSPRDTPFVMDMMRLIRRAVDLSSIPDMGAIARDYRKLIKTAYGGIRGVSPRGMMRSAERDAGSLPPPPPETYSPPRVVPDLPPGLSRYIRENRGSAAGGGAAAASLKPVGGVDHPEDCSGKPKEACVGENCLWVDGAKRKQCRRRGTAKKNLKKSRKSKKAIIVKKRAVVARKTQKKKSPAPAAAPCAGRAHSKCKGPNCLWVDGAKRKQCRTAKNAKK